MTNEKSRNWVSKFSRLSTVLVLSLVVFSAFTAPAAAQDSTSDEGGKEGYINILENLKDIVFSTLQYAGLATLALGAIVWFTARKNSSRAQTGMWLFMGGMAMTIFYFGMNTFLGLLEWIANG